MRSESRNFRLRRHAPKKCDLIVCREHNWPDCPKTLEVIALKDELERLSDAKYEAGPVVKLAQPCPVPGTNSWKSREKQCITGRSNRRTPGSFELWPMYQQNATPDWIGPP